MASDLEALILTPAASFESWRSQFHAANRTESSANSEGWHLEATELDSLHCLAVPRNSVHENYEQNQSQRAALAVTNLVWEKHDR